MGTLFRDVWLWCLLSFLLGSLMTWAVMRATREPKVEITEERLAGPAMGERMSDPMVDRSGDPMGDRSGDPMGDRAGRTGAAAAGTAGMAGAAATGARAARPPGDKATAMAGSGSAMRMVQPGDFPGSARSNADGSAPSPEYTVKGDARSMIYHTPDSPSYRDTGAEVWFKSTIEAERAGFLAWNKNPKDVRSRRA